MYRQCPLLLNKNPEEKGKLIGEARSHYGKAPSRHAPGSKGKYKGKKGEGKKADPSKPPAAALPAAGSSALEGILSQLGEGVPPDTPPPSPPAPRETVMGPAAAGGAVVAEGIKVAGLPCAAILELLRVFVAHALVRHAHENHVDDNKAGGDIVSEIDNSETFEAEKAEEAVAAQRCRIKSLWEMHMEATSDH